MIHINRSSNLVEGLQALPMLSSLTQWYPDFEHWFLNKALPGIVLGQDQLLVARDDGLLVGVVLIKKSRKETKLRCVRVVPTHQNTGLGIRLIDAALEALETSKPHCTVAEEMLHTYSRLFVQRYGFALNAVEKGLYRPGKLEYVFNQP